MFIDSTSASSTSAVPYWICGGHAGHLRADDVQVVGQRHGLVERRLRQARQVESRHREQDGRGLAGSAQQAKE